MVPSPMLAHQIVTGEVFTLLNDYKRRSGGLALIAPLEPLVDKFVVGRVWFARSWFACTGAWCSADFVVVRRPVSGSPSR